MNPNYARQIILRLNRQGLIFPHPTFAGGQTYKGKQGLFFADKKGKNKFGPRQQKGKRFPKKLPKRFLIATSEIKLYNKLITRQVKMNYGVVAREEGRDYHYNSECSR